MLEKLEEHIKAGRINTRMNCISFCVGWLESEGKTALPFSTIEHIIQLYYDGKLID